MPQIRIHAPTPVQFTAPRLCGASLPFSSKPKNTVRGELATREAHRGQAGVTSHLPPLRDPGEPLVDPKMQTSPESSGLVSLPTRWEGDSAEGTP